MAELREKTEIRLEKKNIVRMRQRDEKNPRVSCEDTQQNRPIKPGRPKTMSSLLSDSLIFTKYKKKKTVFTKRCLVCLGFSVYCMVSFLRKPDS